MKSIFDPFEVGNLKTGHTCQQKEQEIAWGVLVKTNARR